MTTTTQEPTLRDLFIEVTLSIIFYIVIIYFIYSNSMKYDRKDQQIKYVLLVLLFAGIARLLGKWMHIKDMYGKETENQNLHLISAIATFIFIVVVFYKLKSMI